jgi:hypothetical protein
MRVKEYRRIFYRVTLEDGRVVGVRINEVHLIPIKVETAEEVTNYQEFKKLTPLKVILKEVI